MNTRHNILFILGDEHRYDCLGCTGNADVKTPVIDAIAGDGTVIDNTFCCYPVCTPSRYSMLCGLYPHQHGGWSNKSTLAPGYIRRFRTY